MQSAALAHSSSPDLHSHPTQARTSTTAPTESSKSPHTPTDPSGFIHPFSPSTDLEAAEGLEDYSPSQQHPQGHDRRVRGEEEERRERELDFRDVLRERKQGAKAWDRNQNHDEASLSLRSFQAGQLPVSHTPSDRIIGRDKPFDIIRIDRDWTAGDIAQFHTSFPPALASRLSLITFLSFLNDVNSHLLLANSFGRAVFDNLLMVLTFHLSIVFFQSAFEKQLAKLERVIELANQEVFNPVGLNVPSPRHKAFLFLEFECY